MVPGTKHKELPYLGKVLTYFYLPLGTGATLVRMQSPDGRIYGRRTLHFTGRPQKCLRVPVSCPFPVPCRWLRTHEMAQAVLFVLCGPPITTRYQPRG